MRDGRLYFFAAGTTTLQSAYQDVALTLPYPNPIVLDSAGRVPAFYLADGQIKIRMTNAAGVTQVAADNLLVIGASSGSGSPPSVDATTVLQVGDLKARYGTGAHTGWVRANGRTIGSGSSGATERANADCQELFEYLWTEDANLAVSTGRGASAAADWAANKTIALPDWRGCNLAGLDDMGASAAGRLTSSFFGTAATVLGAFGGSESHANTVAQTPTLTANGTGTATAPNGKNFVTGTGSQTEDLAVGVNQRTIALNQSANATTAAVEVTTTTSGTGGATGNAHNNVPPTRLATIYIKL